MKASTAAMIIFFIGLLGMAYMHEQVHVQIYKSYSIESHVEYLSHFPDLVTIAEDNCFEDGCTLAHNINEVASYPLLIFYTVFGFLFILLLIEVEGE